MLLAWWIAAQAAHTGPAAAAVPIGEVAPVTQLDAPHSVRSGVVVGFAIGAGLGGASGYPNDSNQIGDPNFYSASGWMVGPTETLFLMGALTDYLNVGFFYSHSNLRNGDWHSNGDGGGLRLEVFPLAVAFPRWSGLGAFAQFGIGSGSLAAATPGLPAAQGTQSFGAAGVLYEWSFLQLMGGHLAAGPSLEYDAIWSLPFERHGLMASARLAFYGGP
jgi:hypothetical protein